MNLPMKRRLVAYLDVLGFRQMVENDPSQDKIGRYFETLEFELPQQVADKLDIRIEYLVFSDTVVLTADYEEGIEYLCKFLLRVRNLQWKFALMGVWLRGGIAIGLLHLDTSKNRIVGKGLNRAYDLEKQAIYPRVLIDPRIIDAYGLIRSDFVKEVNSRSVHESGKDLIFDYHTNPGISHYAPDGIHIHFLGPFKWCFENDIRDVYEHIKAACNTNQELYGKYRWLIDYAYLSALETKASSLGIEFDHL